MSIALLLIFLGLMALAFLGLVLLSSIFHVFLPMNYHFFYYTYLSLFLCRLLHQTPDSLFGIRQQPAKFHCKVMARLLCVGIILYQALLPLL